MGWLAALAILTAIGLIPVGVSLTCENSDFLIKLRVLMFSFDLPRGKKKKEGAVQPEAEKKEKKHPQKPEPEPEPEPETKPAAAPRQKHSLKDYLPFVHLAFDFLGSLRKKLRIEKLWAKVILAGEDPCDLAVLYGRTWAGVSTLMGNLNQIFMIKDQNVDVQCDFTADKTKVSARLDMTITIGKVLGLAAGYGVRALKEFLIFKKRKGGAIK